MGSHENSNTSGWSKNDPRGEVNDQIRQLVLADTSTRSLGRSNNVSMYACTNELAVVCACARMYMSACCRCMGYFSLSPARANYVGVRMYPVHVHQLLTHVWSSSSTHTPIGCVPSFWTLSRIPRCSLLSHLPSLLWSSKFSDLASWILYKKQGTTW